MLTWSWIVEEFDRKSGEFVRRQPLHGFTDQDALELLGMDELGPADLFDLSESALNKLSERFEIEVSTKEFEYFLGREAV